MICKTEAIVLRSFDLRETSKITIFFTKDHGKVKGVLKGIRKDHRKFGSSVDKFSVNDIVYYQYRNSEIHLVSQCDLKEFYFPVREDLKRSMAAAYLLELIDKIMPLEEKNVKVYHLMKDYLSSLGEEKDIDKLVHMLQIKVLLLSGFKPHLDSCVVTNQRIGSRAKFSLKHGGLVAKGVKLSEGPIMTISSGAVSSILYIERNSWDNCLRLRLTPAVQKELKFVLNNFLVFHLGRRLKTEQFM